jgi:broad specificity phosphatase PhoE
VDKEPAATFVVVRHAEKAQDDPRDPSPAGRARAERLAGMLADAPLAAVYATPFRRTRATAQPAARLHGLTVTTYDAAQPAAALAARLRASHARGTVLVVGHSNTAPALAAALCACVVEPMPKDEYGRYYRLGASPGAPARLEVLAW